MSDYIFKPPPPPPPKAAAPPTNQNQNQWNRGGGNRGRGGRGRGGGGRGNHRGGYSGPPQQQQAPAAHLNPAFFPQFAPQLQPQPPSASPPNPFFQQWSPQPPSPAPTTLRSYSDLTPPPAPSSYGRFAAPPTPAPPKQGRPDMSHEEWLALNGGKLLGTNIKPPETAEEIAAWIAERKARFPSAKRREQKAREEAERRARQQEEEEKKKAAAQEEKKRKREEEDQDGKGEGEEGSDQDDDAPPDEISAHTRTVFRDDRKKPQQKKVEECRAFRRTGKCPRGEECKYQHPEKREKKKLRPGNQRKEEKTRPSLYQRLVEKEMDRENEVLLEVIKFLVETGTLRDEPAKEGEAKGTVEVPEPLVEALEENQDEVEKDGE
ncbi:hypothetical protein FN846DRAFT_118156 [Sphaerosporella brunnea]|uniref:C3H1-type domain-containing protein n=1 Tax=Sphaerosporella brunnea TaxID=1250544 RepID=A0A5J5ESA8_9PEZI|nr:hypothetical protein FN846DRAFT_118156 [Sphaerosporella brunnea]